MARLISSEMRKGGFVGKIMAMRGNQWEITIRETDTGDLYKVFYAYGVGKKEAKRQMEEYLNEATLE